HLRLMELFRKTRDRHFDLILASNIYRSLWPPNKRFATRLSCLLRFSTYQIHRSDTTWAPLFARHSKVPMAVIDFRDAPFVLSADWPLLRESTLYFKRELFFWPQKSLLPLGEIINFDLVRPHAQKLRPFSWGTPRSALSHLTERPIPIIQRDIDLFMSGTGNPIRKNLYDRCLKLARHHPHLKIVAYDQFISEQTYREMLQRSKMVLCPESHACDNHRQYDVAAAGAVPALNWPYSQTLHPLLPDQHAVYFSLFGNDFENKILEALSRPDLLQSKAEALRQWVQTVADRRALASYIVHETLRAAIQ
ncbi:MAG: hypothetical protein NZM04_01620, partial [Methylacidiphilales bacterium]|nr:hypothetical protein [Candidatus Methylacidiphilales bacterium]